MIINKVFNSTQYMLVITPHKINIKLFCDSKKDEVTPNENKPKNEEIMTISQGAIEPYSNQTVGKLEITRSRTTFISQILNDLSPTKSRGGKIFFLVIIILLIIIILNYGYIVEKNKKNRLCNYELLFFQKKFKEVITLASESINSKDCTEDYYYRALAYFMIHEEKNALQDFKVVVDRGDSHLALISSSLCYSCFAFIYCCNYESALNVIEESLNINPYSSVAYQGKGEALMGLQRFDEALEAFDKSLAIDPENSDCLNKKVTVYQIQKKNDLALEIIDKILLKDMFNQTTHKNKVQILFELKHFEKAIQQIEIIETLFGTNCQLYYLKGDALAQLGKYNDALFNIENALFVNQGNFSRDMLERLNDLREYCQRRR